MRELVRLVEEPRTCSYLPREKASLEYRILQDLQPGEYEDLLARGYRRFGRQIFRPACPRCEQCVSIRVLVDRFEPSRSQRRVVRRNRDVEAIREPAYVADAFVELYNRYHSFMAETRGWRHDRISRSDYFDSFVAGGQAFAWQWLFLRRGRLVGVALMDETPAATSLVYFFHEPSWRPDSPGVFSILTQLEYSKSRGKRYAYPGYWIEANRSMSYKSRFRPFETLAAHPVSDERPLWSEAANPIAVTA